jgi:hypothetical protein
VAHSKDTAQVQRAKIFAFFLSIFAKNKSFPLDEVW